MHSLCGSLAFAFALLLPCPLSLSSCATTTAPTTLHYPTPLLFSALLPFPFSVCVSPRPPSIRGCSAATAACWFSPPPPPSSPPLPLLSLPLPHFTSPSPPPRRSTVASLSLPLPLSVCLSPFPPTPLPSCRFHLTSPREIDISPTNSSNEANIFPSHSASAWTRSSDCVQIIVELACLPCLPDCPETTSPRLCPRLCASLDCPVGFPASDPGSSSKLRPRTLPLHRICCQSFVSVVCVCVSECVDVGRTGVLDRGSP